MTMLYDPMLPLRPPGVPEEIPGYASPPVLDMPPPEALPLLGAEQFPTMPPPPALGPEAAMPAPPPPEALTPSPIAVQPLPAQAPLRNLPLAIPADVTTPPQDREQLAIEQARRDIGYQAPEISPTATPGQRMAAEAADVTAMASADILAQKRIAAERAAEAKRIEEERAADEAKRRADAEAKTAAARDRYRETLRGGAKISGAQWAGLIGAALADAVAVALQPTGQQRSMFPQIMDSFMRANQATFDGQVKAALDEVTEGQETVDRIVTEDRTRRQQYELQRAAIAAETAERLDEIATKAQGSIQAINAKNAADMARAAEQQSLRKAALEEYELETKRAATASEVAYKQATLEQRERESKRETWKALELEKMRGQRERELKELDVEATKGERQRKMLETGQLIDSATGKPIATSRFYEKPDQMIKDQDAIDQYVVSQKKFNEYIDLLKKAGRIGPVEGRIKDDVQQRLDMLHKEILSATISSLAGAAVSEEEMKRISATIPGPKSWRDLGSWDPVKQAEKYAAGMADKIDTMLVGRSLPEDRAQVKERSPTARFRAISRTAAETPEDKIQSHILHRDPTLRNQMALNYLGRLRSGDVTQEEARTIAQAFSDVATADILSDEETKIYRRYADIALDAMERPREWSENPRLKELLELGDAWVSGDTAALKRARGDKSKAEQERETIRERAQRVLK